VVGGALVGLITPALGEISSHRWVTRGMGVRAAGLGIATFGAIGMIVSSEDGDPEIPPSRTSVGVVVVGAALYLGGAILDIVDAPGAARAWNARHPQRFVVAPTVLHTQHSSAAGVALGFGF
jgi:hypothetical protein